ncbi:MAG TPA: hypothetical protein VGP76_15970, partial [Planctomycetaceae bacterium]|nr:hypothetical protein [Planctomycetaceae bacterium]
GTGRWDWDGTLGLGRDIGTGTGHRDWDGTSGLGRDIGTGTGHRDWDGTLGLRRDTGTPGSAQKPVLHKNSAGGTKSRREPRF